MTSALASPATRALEAHDLYRFYHAGEDETLALRGISLQVIEGETVVVVGPSGSGKSTLLACLAGLDEPDGGHVVVDGVRMSRRDESTRAMLRATKLGITAWSSSRIIAPYRRASGRGWPRRCRISCSYVWPLA